MDHSTAWSMLWRMRGPLCVYPSAPQWTADVLLLASLEDAVGFGSLEDSDCDLDDALVAGGDDCDDTDSSSRR